MTDIPSDPSPDLGNELDTRFQVLEDRVTALESASVTPVPVPVEAPTETVAGDTVVDYPAQGIPYIDPSAEPATEPERVPDPEEVPEEKVPE